MALVNGAASGMGLATANAFTESGAAIVLADFREEAVKAEAQGLIAAGPKAIGVRCDVSDESQVAAMVALPIQAIAQPTPMGHEYCGIAEEVGKEVKSIKPGQFVVGSLASSDNTCVICRHGFRDQETEVGNSTIHT